MPGMRDAARSLAAIGGGAELGAMPPELAVPDPAMEQVPTEPSPLEDIETGIAMIEAALEALPTDKAQRARELLEGLKEVAAEGEAAGQEPATSEAPLPTEKPEGAY